MNYKRKDEYSLLKTFATLLVVAAHITVMYASSGSAIEMPEVKLLNWATLFLYAFHMPLFLFLSGAIYHQCISVGKYKIFSSFLLTKSKRLLIPYFVFGIFYVTPVMFLLRLTDSTVPKYIFSGILLNEDSRHLWYLYVLFLMFVVIRLLQPLLARYPQFVYFLLVFSIFLAYNYLRFPLTFGMLYFARNFCYFLFGYIFNQNKDKWKSFLCKYWLLVVLIFLITVASSVLFWNEALKIAAAFTGIIACYAVASKLPEFIYDLKLYKELQCTGMGIYLFHPMIIYVAFYFGKSLNPNPYLFCCIVFFIAMILSYLITKLLQKTKMKAILLFLFFFLTFATVTPIKAEASTVEETEENISTVSFQEQLEMYLYFEDVVKEAILTGEDSISLTELELSVADYDLSMVNKLSPYFGNGIRIHAWRNSNTNLYSFLEIKNPMTLEETKAYFEKVDARLSSIKEMINDDMPEALKALTIYDIVVNEASYGDLVDENDEYLADTNYSSGVLMFGKGRCDSYTHAILYLANMIGMECYRTTSDEMNHSWNIIKIDDEYYHMDAAWFDDGSVIPGRLTHSLFLCSDAEMIEKNHSGWDLTEIVCDSERYNTNDEAFWSTVFTRVFIDGNYAYYLNGESILKRDLETGDTKILLKDLGTWYIWDTNWSWQTDFSGLALYDGELYYNTPYEIRKMSTDGTNDVLVYKPDTSNGYIYGCSISDDMLQFTVRQSEIQETAIQSIPAKGLPFHDISSYQWYYSSVDYVYRNGIVAGLTPTSFGPDQTLTRAQFATILSFSAGSEPVTYDNRFQDIPENQWYSSAVIWANNVGVVSGLSATTYGPDEPITREQMVTMMFRYTNYLGCDTGSSADLSGYADSSQISSYAVESMKWAVANGIISGKTSTTLDPLGQATRAECAAIIMRFLEKYQ